MIYYNIVLYLSHYNQTVSLPEQRSMGEEKNAEKNTIFAFAANISASFSVRPVSGGLARAENRIRENFS